MPLTDQGRDRLRQYARRRQRDWQGRFCRENPCSAIVSGFLNATASGYATSTDSTEAYYRSLHNRESEAILQSEGIANPRAWDEETRRQARRAVNLDAQNAQSITFTGTSISNTTYNTVTPVSLTAEALYPDHITNITFVDNPSADDRCWVDEGAGIRRYVGPPEPITVSARISDQLLRNGIPNAVETTVRQLQLQAEHEWLERYEQMPQDPVWLCWIQRQGQFGEGHEIGLTLSDRESEVRGAWHRWMNQGVETTVVHGRPRVPTPEERQAAEERLERIEQANRDHEEANERAEALLKDHLTPEQREDWERANRFEVIVGEKRYRVTKGRAGNVMLLDEKGNPVQRYCIHARDQMPDADHCLSQKFLLESDEERFLQVANASRP